MPVPWLLAARAPKPPPPVDDDEPKAVVDPNEGPVGLVSVGVVLVAAPKDEVTPNPDDAAPGAAPNEKDVAVPLPKVRPATDPDPKAGVAVVDEPKVKGDGAGAAATGGSAWSSGGPSSSSTTSGGVVAGTGVSGNAVEVEPSTAK